MSPLRWIHGTISHWTVILDDVLVAPTLLGGSDGAVCERLSIEERQHYTYHDMMMWCIKNNAGKPSDTHSACTCLQRDL